jgi:hypothetical protein
LSIGDKQNVLKSGLSYTMWYSPKGMRLFALAFSRSHPTSRGRACKSNCFFFECLDQSFDPARYLHRFFQRLENVLIALYHYTPAGYVCVLVLVQLTSGPDIFEFSLQHPDTKTKYHPQSALFTAFLDDCAPERSRVFPFLIHET